VNQSGRLQSVAEVFVDVRKAVEALLAHDQTGQVVLDWPASECGKPLLTVADDPSMWSWRTEAHLSEVMNYDVSCDSSTQGWRFASVWCFVTHRQP
jgi:hypothetical protein